MDDHAPKPDYVGGQVPTIYLTKEQLQRLAAIALDSLVGLQLHTDASDRSYVTGEVISIDDPNSMGFYTVFTDGSFEWNT